MGKYTGGHQIANLIIQELLKKEAGLSWRWMIMFCTHYAIDFLREKVSGTVCEVWYSEQCLFSSMDGATPW